MSLKKILLVTVTTLVVYSGFALPCQAQNTLDRRRTLRWLGQGFSDGYHRHNPGHDTSYYNPYTAHNSTLISRSPEYQALLAQQAYQKPAQRFFSGVPFSVYAAPSQLTPGIQNLPGQQFQGSFSPSVGSGLATSEDDDSDNSFKRDDDDNDFRDDDDNDFRGDDDDMDAQDNDDNDFGDDDMEKEEAMDRLDSLESDDEFRVLEDKDGDAKELGGLSGLNDSLSFDFD